MEFMYKVHSLHSRPPDHPRMIRDAVFFCFKFARQKYLNHCFLTSIDIIFIHKKV